MDKNVNNIGINRQIIKLSVPAIVSNITVPLLGLSDTAISGHLGDAVYLAAIAVGSMMLNVLTWLMGFLRMGTTGIVARAFGAGDRDKMSAVLSVSCCVGLAIGLGVLVLQYPIQMLLLDLISPEPEVSQLAIEYFKICIWGLPAILCNMAFTGWFIGRQSTFWPMVVAISANIINICLSFLLAFPFGFGFKGVAIGTLSANWIALIISITASFKVASGKAWMSNIKEAFKGADIKEFFGINTDLFFRSACVMLVSMAVTAIGARLGESILATNAVMMQFFTFFSFFMDGFAFTGEALCGRYSGASDKGMLYKSVKALLWWSGGIMLIFTLLYLTGWREVTSILTDVESVRYGVAQYHLWVILIPPITVLAFIFDGFYIGLTRTRRMLVVTLVAAMMFFIVALFGFQNGVFKSGVFDNNKLWLAFLTYLFTRGVGLGIMLPKVLKKSIS